MKLQRLKKNEIKVGEPMPWPVYDKNRNLLLQKGVVVTSQRQIDLMAENGLYRKPDVQHAPAPAPKPEKEEKPQPKAPPPPPVHKVSFSSLKLNVGDTLQMSPLDIVVSGKKETYYVKLIGYLDKQSLLVTTPIVAGQKLLVKEGYSFSIRSFSGTDVYTFEASVLRVHNSPYAYLHLTYPDMVEGVALRKSKRIKVNIIGAASNAKNGEDAEKVPCVVSDLSMTGAMVDSRKLLGEVKDMLNVCLRVSVAGVDLYVTLPGVICIIKTNQTAGDPEPMYHHGIEFKDISLKDRIVLQNYIYQVQAEES